MPTIPDQSEPLADDPAGVEVLDSAVVFEGRVWDVRSERFRYGDTELVREFVAHTGAVAVLAIDDSGRVLLIRQYRHPIRSRDWELPAGLLDIEGEEPLETAQRELAEEADLRAEHWERLVEFHTTPGGSDELVRIFLARGLSATEAFERDAEEQDIELRWVALEDAVDAVLDGRIRNGILTVAVLAAHARRG